MRITIMLAAAVTLGACANSSGVQPVGPDTYTVFATAGGLAGGTAGAVERAMGDANAHCASQGRQIAVDALQSGGGGADEGSVSVVFKCLLPGDPQLQRPQVQFGPDVTIKVQ